MLLLLFKLITFQPKRATVAGYHLAAVGPTSLLFIIAASLCVSGANSTTSSEPEPAPLDQQQQQQRQQQQQHHIDKLDANYLAQTRGFQLETHQFVTRDQYILTAHRLVNPLLANDARPSRGLVILQHGILSASSMFLVNSSPELDRPSSEFFSVNKRESSSLNTTTSAIVSNSLAIALAQRGHDVWLTNFRGTQYSRGRRLLKPLAGSRAGHRAANATATDTDAVEEVLAPTDQDDEEPSSYWNFNVDTLIEHDFEAHVSHILEHTRQKSYTFVGHSLGATVGLGSLLVHHGTPVTSRLACSVLMAPVASTQFMRGSLMRLFRMASLLYSDPAPFPGQSDSSWPPMVVRRLCLLAPRLCTWLTNSFVGAKQGDKQQSMSTLLRAAGSQPSSGNAAAAAADDDDDDEFENQVNTFVLMMHQSISIQMLKHIVQVHVTGRLSRYDYGREANLLAYNASVAPAYELTQIDEPHLRLAIISGPSDAISTPDEIDWIASQVHGRVGHFERVQVPMDPFNHMDLVLSRDAGRLVNKQVLEFIERNKCFRNHHHRKRAGGGGGGGGGNHLDQSNNIHRATTTTAKRLSATLHSSNMI